MYFRITHNLRVTNPLLSDVSVVTQSLAKQLPTQISNTYTMDFETSC